MNLYSKHNKKRKKKRKKKKQQQQQNSKRDFYGASIWSVCIQSAEYMLHV